jgi:hypothetical protein
VSGPLRIVVGATTAPWSAALRSYVRDHAQGVRVEVVMGRAGLSRSLLGASALVIDDVMRTFSSLDVFKAQRSGVFVIGVADQAGAGRKYLADLGVDKVVAASVPPAELLALASEASEGVQGPEVALTSAEGQGASAPAWVPAQPGGVVSAWTKVSGGAGLSEAVVAAAESLSKAARVLLVEAEELTPVMLSRLSRSPEGGLPWALSRVGQGLPALPEALSAPRREGPTVGHFDVVCGAANPAQPLNASQLEIFIAEAAACYDCVLVETSWLVGPGSARERFSATRSVLRRANSVVVLAAADPEGAARLVQWRAMAVAHRVQAPAWAVFGRARPGGYERSHLEEIVCSNTGRYPFAGLAFLPEDASVARARWNGELAYKGPFQKAAGALAAQSVAAFLRSRRGRSWPRAAGSGPRATVATTAVLVGGERDAGAHNGSGRRR